MKLKKPLETKDYIEISSSAVRPFPLYSRARGGITGSKFVFSKMMPPPMPPDKASVFRRKLSDAFICSLTEPGKHAHGDVPGLYLEVRASSKVGKPPSKFWRLKYRLHGKENRFSTGAYPNICLKEARDIARGARCDVANHIAPLKAKTAKIEAQLLNEERAFAYVAEQ